MERDGSKFLLILVSMMMMVLAASVQAESVDCEKSCDAECAGNELFDVCKVICIRNCEIPPSKVSKTVKDCSLGCAASICTQFTEGIFQNTSHDLIHCLSVIVG